MHMYIYTFVHLYIYTCLGTETDQDYKLGVVTWRKSMYADKKRYSRPRHFFGSYMIDTGVSPKQSKKEQASEKDPW